MIRPTFATLQRLLLLFWGVYFTFVVGSNVGDALKGMGVLSKDAVYASGNLGMIEQVISIYSLPPAVAAILFGLVILLEITIAILFFISFADRDDLASTDQPKTVRPFFFALLLWTGFILSDEFFIAYDKFGGLEGAHVAMFAAQLLSLVVVRVGRSDKTT